MAFSSHRLLLRLSILLGLVAIGVNARPGVHFHPCNILILFSTSSYSLPSLDENPNFSLHESSSSSSSSVPGGRFMTFFFTEIREFDPKPALPSYETVVVDRADADEGKHTLPFGFYSSSAAASFRDRTKDVMSAVGALLFGVGCGALTAATMYLVWSLFSPNRFDFGDSDGEFDDDDNDDGVNQKMGYVAIPAVAPPAAAAPAKQVE